ncbi:tRNA-dihydrouridine synthase [Thermodesulfobacteriota bacterium]
MTKPISIKGKTFKNRIVFPPVQTDLAAGDGAATDRMINFYTRIAANNVGLTIVGATGISASSRLGANSFCLYDQSHIAQAKHLFKAMGETGSIPAVQLNHGGRAMRLDLAGERLVGPSAIPSPRSKNTPVALTTEEVEEIVGQFVQTAVNAKTAGAAMVEFHSAHSFLLNQFLSPAANKRTDKYGGTTEKRALIVREIIQQAREKLGKDFIIGLRMSVEEFVENGLGVGESLEMLNMFIEDGLDIIHVSGGGLDSGGAMIKAAAKGNLIKLAGIVKKQVAIPVIGVGGILKLEQAEAAVSNGLVDMVAMGRALIADPELVTKTLDGRIDDVVECTGCMQCFVPSPEPGITCPENENI